MMLISEAIIQLNSIGKRKLYHFTDIQEMISRQLKLQSIFWEDEIY
jgi:hypothetical protein